MANPSFDRATQSDGVAIKLIAFGKETLSRAQASVSTVIGPGSTKTSLMGGNYRLIPITEEREFVEKGYGLVDTPVAEQKYKRRAIWAKVYHMATRVDIGDLVDISSNPLLDAQSELMKAEARLMDKLGLSSIVEPAYESGDSGEATQIGSPDTVKRIQASVDLKRWNKLMIYHDAGTGSKVKFDPDTVEKIEHVYNVRDVTSDLCATLTPAVRLKLATDAAFKNAENIFSKARGSVDDYREGFIYKSILWVKTSQSVLPVIDQLNCGLTAYNAATKVTNAVTAASIALGSDQEAPRGYAGDLKTSIANIITEANKTANKRFDAADSASLAAANTKTLTFKSKDLCYIWGKSRLLFAVRPEENMVSYDVLPMISLARQGYIRVSFGAMLLDDDYAIVVPVTGTLS